jgi:hypothetical protein
VVFPTFDFPTMDSTAGIYFSLRLILRQKVLLPMMISDFGFGAVETPPTYGNPQSTIYNNKA